MELVQSRKVCFNRTYSLTELFMAPTVPLTGSFPSKFGLEKPNLP